MSRWWTQDEPGGPRDDVFWRTAGSGARATSRAKKGKKTKNQHNDLCAIDPVGQPFVDLFAVEMKRGYSSRSIFDLLDQKPKAGGKCYQEWIDKVQRTHKAVGTWSWMLIVQRNRRHPVVILPSEGMITNSLGMTPRVTVELEWPGMTMFVTPLDVFLKKVHPREVIGTWKSRRAV